MKKTKFEINGKDYQSGQVLLISLLVLVVVLTVGLSTAVRSITTTRMTSAEDSSQRAFSAAEAGIEQALTAIAGDSKTGTFSANNSSYTASVTESADSEFLVNNGAFIPKDDAADVWLSSPPGYTTSWNGSLEIYWGNSAIAPVDVCNQSEIINTMAAMEVILISGTAGAPTIEHFAYDPCAARKNTNKFVFVPPGGATIDGKIFAYKVSIPVTNGLMARLVPLYAGTYIGVKGVGLPAQGVVITSIGKSGGTQRKIVTFRGYPKPPIELYPYLIFSPK